MKWKNVTRKLCFNFEVFSLLRSTPIYLQNPECPPRRTCLVTDCSQWYILRKERSMHVTWKLCINFEVSSFLRSTPSPRCLQSVLQGVLRGDAWFLTVVNDVFHDRNAVCMSPESFVSILKSLASLEVPHLLGVSRASSKESKRTCLIRDCS